MQITAMLARNARDYGDDIALIERRPEEGQRRTLTWQEFDELANRTANALRCRGIGRGDRVALLMYNCVEWLPIYFGILRSGAVAVPLNFRFEARTLVKCLATAGARLLIFGGEFTERIDSIRSELKTILAGCLFCGAEKSRPEFAEDWRFAAAQASAHAPELSFMANDAAGLYFTSGTTGTPKATMLTHGNLAAAAFVEQRHHRQRRQDNFLCIPPLYHTGAKMHWFGNLVAGAPAVILCGVRPRWILEAISEEAVTIAWLLVPWALDILWAVESGEVRLADYRLAQWRLMHIGAQPVPPTLVEQWLRVFPNQRYDTNYGLTEASGPGCVHLGMDNVDKVGAIGKPGHGWEVKIVDEQGNPVAPGSPGELAVRGPGVMKGYDSNPEATAAVLVDGWLLTGDIARQDQDGFIWLVDRKKDVIITGGENIFPVEIEDFLQGHPDIYDVAVIGLPDRRLGEVAAAVVKPKAGRSLTSAGILQFCRALPRYKRPRRILFGDVPRNPTGKIEKPKLRRRYASN